MNRSISSVPVATEGKGNADGFQPSCGLERPGKSVAIGCLNGAIESFIQPLQMSRAQFAETFCGMGEANFSKVVNGNQGDFWALVYKLPSDIRADFFGRLHESEHIDPLELATEQLKAAAERFLRLTAAAQLPGQASHMAKAVSRVRVKKAEVA